MAIDPVCGMQVDEATATITSSYKGQTYYFCSPTCRTSFNGNPEQYLEPGKPDKPGETS